MDFTTSATVAHRMMVLTDQLQLWRKGKRVKIKTASDAMQASNLTSGCTQSSSISTNRSCSQKMQNDRVNLAELCRRVDLMRSGQGQDTVSVTTGRQDTAATDVKQTELKVQRQTVEIKLELNYNPNTPVEGLVRRSNQVAETDRYLFNFEDGSTFTIIDKWANRSTTIWGDPHVDLSDVEGQNNGDFQDLKASTTHTTFVLADNTRVSFTAEDTGIIEAVDISKGSQSLHGIGAGSKDWDGEDNGLFNQSVRQNSACPVISGDVVYAGGDGNDWFDSTGKMVWGKTTGPAATRPSGYLTAYIEQTVTTETATLQVNSAA